MKVAIMGAGSIGRRHARNLARLGANDLHAYDPDATALSGLAQYGVTLHSTREELLDIAPDAVLVCTPPHLHLESARAALHADAHLFIEKPIAHELDGIEEFLLEAHRRGRVVMVGYNWRFEPALRKMYEFVDAGRIGELLAVTATAGQYLPDWRPGSDYRRSYFANHETGGGIILDGSHEIDLVRSLLGEIASVGCLAAKISELELEVEDIAFISLTAVTGALGEISIDCVRRTYTRRCSVIGSAGTIEWDVTSGLRLMNEVGELVEIVPATADRNAMYVEEMRQFLHHAATGTAPLVDGQVGRKVLAVALAARRAAELRMRVTV
jgi:predicted dehydrogenase